MEQIRKAVHRARLKAKQQDLQNTEPQPSHTRAYAGYASNGARSKPELAVVNEDLRSIEYTQTRIIEADPALIRGRRVVAHLDGEVSGNLFRVLRSQVLQKMRTKGLKTLAIVGPTPGVGKSLVAANLSLAISRETNQTVLLSDFDLRRGRVGWHFGLDENEVGLAGFLQQDDLELPALLVNPGFERLTLLPSGECQDDVSELLTSQKAADLLLEMRERYESRVILADLPPLLVTDDALAILPQFDAALLVVEDGKTTTEEIEACKRLLADTPLVGVVLNKSNVPDQSSEYGYTKYYQRRGS